MEDWKQVRGYPRYEINCAGTVRNVRTGRALKHSINQEGYPCVGLYKGDHPEKFQVHRLVALNFIGDPPSDRHEVAHWDGDRANPHFSNLRWATKSQNSRDRNRSGVPFQTMPFQRKLTDCQVLEIRSHPKTGRHLWDLAEKYGVSRDTIKAIRSFRIRKNLAVA